MRISIDGNIASGKSECLEALHRAFPDLPCFPEPLEHWGDLLEAYYKDKETWALPFSLKVLLTFKDSNTATPHCFVERSPLSCKHVFTHMLMSEGTMGHRQWDVFCEYWDTLGWKPDALIYIDTPAAICIDRLRERNRSGEQDVDVQYLRRIEYAYETMLRQNMDGIPVIRIDGSKSPREVSEAVIRAARDLLSCASVDEV